MIRNLRMSPLAFITGPSKLRLILDLFFGKGGGVDEHPGVNGDTNFEAAPKVCLEGNIPRILARVCGLRYTLSTTTLIMITQMDVKAAHR